MTDERYQAAMSADLDDTFIRCRAYGHRWEDYSVRVVRKTFEVTQACACGTLRSQVLDSAGYTQAGWKYEHPEGFLLKGLGQLGGEGRAAFRLRSLSSRAKVTQMTRRRRSA